MVTLVVAVLTTFWTLLWPAGGASAQAVTWRVLGDGAADPPTFRRPIALAVDGVGRVYVADDGYGFVIRATGAGEFDGAWGRELNVQEIVKPVGVAVAADGSFYVADRETQAVHHLAPDGNLLASWPAGTPSSLTLDRDGNLLVGYSRADRGTDFLEGKYHLQRVSPSGEQLGRWLLGASGGGRSPSRGTSSSQSYLGVNAVAVDPAGRFLVIDQRTTFYEEGNRKEDHAFTEMKGFEASAPAWSSGYTSTKVVAGGEAGDGPGRLNAAKGIVVDGQGRIFVADTGNHRVQMLASDGTFLAQWGGEGSEPGQFASPAGIAVDGQGRVYVADTGNKRVQVLDSPQ